MIRLNLTECCLLEASGELSDDARARLSGYLASHPRAQAEYEEIQEQMALLRSLPLVELSAAERRRIAAGIKRGIREQLHRQTRAKQAAARWKFASYVLSGLAAAAAVIVVGGVVLLDHSAVQRHQQEKIVGLERATEHLALYRDQTTPYDLALTNVQASINQLQSEGPTLVAGLDNTEMSNVLNALTMPDFDETQIERP